MQVDYIAKRNLKAGHVLFTAYLINVPLASDDPISINEGFRSVALSGNTKHVIHRGDIIRSVSTDIVHTSTTPDLDDMREFLESVRYGETFDLDGVPHILDNFKNPYSETRVGGLQYFRYSFRARKL